MTRPLSVSQMKGEKGRPRQMIPAEGSKTRALYDMLAPGRVVDLIEILPSCGFPTRLSMKSTLERLRSDYGLDIRSLSKGKICRVGEWDGSRYVDHIAAIIKE